MKSRTPSLHFFALTLLISACSNKASSPASDIHQEELKAPLENHSVTQTHPSTPIAPVPNTPNTTVPAVPELPQVYRVPPGHDDPCKITQVAFGTAVGRETNKIFNGDHRYEAFSDEFFDHPEREIKTWLQTLTLFSDSQSGSLGVTPIIQSGLKNNGVYAVTDTVSNKRFILKVVTGKSEANHLWKLQNTFVAYPGCLLREDLNLAYHPKPEDLVALPKTPRILESAYFVATKNIKMSEDSSQLKVSKGTVYSLLLLEAAPGVALTQVPDPESVAAYTQVGKSLAAFHLYHAILGKSFRTLITWTHNDLHPNNIFYHTESKTVSFIDNGNMDRNNNLGGSYLDYDFGQLKYFVIESRFNKKESSVFEMLKNLEIKEAAKQKRKIAEHSTDLGKPDFISPAKALLDALENQQELETWKSSEPFITVEKLINEYNGFVAGYQSVYPTPLKNEVISHFSSKCKSWINSFAIQFTLNGSHASTSLKAGIVRAMPPGLEKCAEGHFE